MKRAHPAAVAVVTLVLAVALAPAAAHAIFVSFGTTELGRIATACLLVCFGNGCGAAGQVQSVDVAPPFFVRGLRRGPESAGSALCDNTPGVTTPVTLPVNLAAGQQLVFDVDLVPTAGGNQERTLEVNDTPLFDLEGFVTPVTSCDPSATASCLADDRFKVRVNWRTELGTRGPGPAVPLGSFASDDSGLFYFFRDDNWEVLLKVLNTCNINDRFWVFAAATTNVEYTISVTDTESQQVKTYFKPQGPPAPAITDTEAFATCP